MSSSQASNSTIPPVGMALWLIKGSLPKRLQWIIDNGFDGVSFLQSVMDDDPAERADAASLIRRSGLNVTYHGNVHQKRNADGSLNVDYVRRVADDVLWWKDAGVDVHSVCFDPIHDKTPDGKRFLWEMNATVAREMTARLNGSGVRVGIENGFGLPEAFDTIDAFQRFLTLCGNDAPGMLYDIGHANIHTRSDGVPGENDIGAYTQAIPFDILEVHVSGNFGQADEHRHVTYGNVDLTAVCRALKHRGYDRQITVEVCVDILNNRYGADLSNAEETTPLLITRDAIRDAWPHVE